MKKIMTRLLSLVLLGAFIPGIVLADSWYLEDGDITVNAMETSQIVSQGGTSKTDSNPIISTHAPGSSKTGATNNAITITAEKNATANVTLKDVNIDTGTTGGAAITTSGEGNVNIELNGTNMVQSGYEHAGVEKKDNGTLTITDENKDGSLTATGGDRGAGIGGGKGGNGSNITVSGGEVTAIGGAQGAGIGGGNGGNGSGIIVSGGDVTATGNGVSDSSGYISNSGAGIGGGAGGNGSQITIKNGKVDATGNNYGAGIGGGNGGTGSVIKIESGNVKAQGGWSGAGIGGGGGKGGNDITVSGGEVTAKGGTLGAGIGGGGNGNGSVIKIDGGQVTAQGGGCGAGIGGGYGGTGSDVTIFGDAQVKAQGGADWNSIKKGAAIGNGGTPSQEGDEQTFDPSKLTVDGFIQTYEPGKNINTDTPDKTIEGQKGDHSWNAGVVTTPATCTTEGVRTYTCTKNPAHTRTEPIPALNHLFSNYIYDNNATYTQDGTETAKCERCNETDTRTAKGTKLTEHTAETVPESKAAAYWVSDPEGQSIPYQAQQKDGVLTVTVQADTASLRGTTGSLRQLEAQGVAEIRFVTNGAQSAFTLSDLLASGTGSFTLTHAVDQVTCTLGDTDISSILK